MEWLVVMAKVMFFAIKWLVIVLAIPFFIGLFTKPKSEIGVDPEERNLKRLKKLGLLSVVIMLISPMAFAEEGVPLTPEQVYEMRGGDASNQQPEQVGIPVYGSPDWHERKAYFDKYEYKNEQGQSVWYNDGATGELMTKEEFLKQTRKSYDKLDAGAVQSLAEHQQYLSVVGDPDHITLNGIQLLRDMRKSIRTQRIQTQKEIAKTVPVKEYEKPKVLVTE